MPQDPLHKSRGQTSRARNQKALLHTSDGNSPHSHYVTNEEPEEDSDQSGVVHTTMSKVKKSKYRKYISSGSSPSSPRSRKTSSKDSTAPKSPKKSEKELVARFRAVSSPSDFYLTDASRDGVKATTMTTRLKDSPAPKSPKKSEKELVARFRAVSSPSDFYLTDASRDGVTATTLTTRLANVEVNQDNGLGYGKEKTHEAKAKYTRVRSIEDVNINQVLGSGTGELNAVETNDRSRFECG
jgi:hypothetical protein